MTREEAANMDTLYAIAPGLTCQCDEEHMCQQCWEEQMQEWEEQELDDFKHLKIEEI